jgi:hypothetical protein
MRTFGVASWATAAAEHNNRLANTQRESEHELIILIIGGEPGAFLERNPGNSEEFSRPVKRVGLAGGRAGKTPELLLRFAPIGKTASS